VAVERRPGVAVFPVEGTGWRWWRDTTFAYVGDRSPAAQFTDAEVKGAIDRARAGLTDVKAERVGNLLRTLLNSRPILARFAQVLDAEGVPYTDEDRRRMKHLYVVVHPASSGC
jgi:hypothetical protein